LEYSDSEGNPGSGGLDSTPLPLAITTDLSTDMGLLEATDATWKQCSWRLMASYCTTQPEWCTTICDLIHATGPEYINIQPYTVNITVCACLLGPTRPAMVTQQCRHDKHITADNTMKALKYSVSKISYVIKPTMPA